VFAAPDGSGADCRIGSSAAGFGRVEIQDDSLNRTK